MAQKNTNTQPKASIRGDIRFIIGSLMGIYGVILLITGIVLGSEGTADIWAGAALLVVGLVFSIWLKISPMKIEQAITDDAATDSITE